MSNVSLANCRRGQNWRLGVSRKTDGLNNETIMTEEQKSHPQRRSGARSATVALYSCPASGANREENHQQSGFP